MVGAAKSDGGNEMVEIFELIVILIGSAVVMDNNLFSVGCLFSQSPTVQ